MISIIVFGDDVYINFEKQENGNIELEEDEKKSFYERTVSLEAEYGFEAPEHPLACNSYDNDDYLYIYYLIREVDEMFRRQNYLPTGEWREGYSEVPYIHLEFVDFNALSTDSFGTLYIDDRKLNVKSGGPYYKNGKEYYQIFFDVKLISRLIEFVTSVFYKLNDDRPQSISLGDRTITVLKPIFSSTGFKRFASDTEETISEIINISLKMIIAHEYSHISNAHIILRKNEEEYSKQKEVAFCLEANADDNAIRLMLSELFYLGVNGPYDYQLALSRLEFADKWSLISFSAFLALSWAYRDEDRRWDENTFESYKGTQHPMFQMRSYNVVSRCINHIYGVLDNSDIDKYQTSDGYGIDKELAKYISSCIVDMIRSFEYCLYYKDKPDLTVTEMLLKEEIQSGLLTHLKDDKSSPISFMIKDSSAQAQNESIKKCWDEVKERLNNYNPRCMLYKTI